MRTALIAVTAATLGLPACTDWEARSQKDGPVWDEAGSEVAYILNEYEFKDHWIVSGGDLRNERHQLRAASPDGSGDRAVSPLFDGGAQVLFYMRDAGYLVVGSESGSFSVVDPAGSVVKTVVARDDRFCSSRLGSFQRMMVIPSVDGTRLAAVETRQSCVLTVTFHSGPPGFDATATFTVDAPDFVRVAWTRSDRVVIETCDDTCGDGYWLVDPVAGVDALPVVDNQYAPCFFTPTSSAWVRADGTEIYVDFDTQELRTRDIRSSPELDGEVTADAWQVGCAQLDGP